MYKMWTGINIKPEKNNNKGIMVVEMCVIMPLILFTIFISIYMLVFIMEKERVRTDMYSMIYMIPLESMDKKSIDSDKENDIKAQGIISENIDTVSYFLDGQIICMTKMEGKMSEEKIGCKTELDLCTDRLRRWQLYGNIAEK